MMARFHWMILVLSLLNQSALAQDIGSLVHQIQNEKSSVRKVDLYLEIANELLDTLVDSSKYYADKALMLSNKIRYDEGKFYSYFFIGKAYDQNRDFEKAKSFYQKTLKGAKLHHDGFEMGDLYHRLGTVELRVGLAQESIHSYEEAVEIWEGLDSLNRLVRTLNNMSYAYRNLGDIPKAISVMNKTLEVSRKIGIPSEIAISLVSLANIKYSHSEYYEALLNYNEALSLFKKENEKELAHYMSICYNNIGNIHQVQGNFNKALSFYEDALALNTKINREEGIASTSANIGLLHSQLGNYDEAEKYVKQSLLINEKLNDSRKISTAQIQLGDIYVSIKDYQQAEHFFKLALQTKKKSKDPIGMATCLASLGELKLVIQQYEAALLYFQQVDAIADTLGHEFTKTAALMGISEAYRGLKSYPKGTPYALESLDLNKKLGLKVRIIQSCKLLTDYYSNLGNYAKALDFYKEASIYKDSLHAENLAKELNKLELNNKIAENKALVEENHQIEIDNQKLEAENLLKSRIIFQKNLINWVVSISLIVFIVLFLFLLHYFRKLREANYKLNIRNVWIREQKDEIASQSEQIKEAYAEIQAINESLEEKVRERTITLEKQNEQLSEYAFINAHLLRKPLATILGLIDIIEEAKDDPETLQELIAYLKLTSNELDNIIHRISEAVESGKHFSREDLNTILNARQII